MTDERHVHLSGTNRISDIGGVQNPRNELVNKSPRSVLKVTVWVAIGWDDIIELTFLKMMMAEQSQLAKSTMVKCLKSSITELRRKAQRRDNRIQMRTQ